MGAVRGAVGCVAFHLLCLLLITFSIENPVAKCEKLKYALENECDRYSLDALYHEKYNVETEDVFGDSIEFVNRIIKLTTDSVMIIMANLPGRDSSDDQELRVYKLYDETRRKFIKDVNKIRRNITAAWRTLRSSNYNLLIDKANSSLESVRNNISMVVETYKHSRKTMDNSMAGVLTHVKPLVRDGLKSIINTAKAELQKRKNDTKSDPDSVDESENEGDYDEEEELGKIVKNITMDIVPSFLGKVTLSVYDRHIDLQKEVDMNSGQRDSPLDDLYFTLSLVQTRVYSLIRPDLPKGKEYRDTARRNLYMYWTELATTMYKDKIKSSKAATSVGRKDKYRKLWENEDDLADTLINLLQTYP